MNLFAMMETSGGAMQAERMRAEVVAANMANAETTRTATGGPTTGSMWSLPPMQAIRSSPTPSMQPRGRGFGEAPRKPCCGACRRFRAASASRSMLNGSGPAAPGVHIAAVVEDTSPPLKRYDPGHPDAGPDGYVSYPDINPLTEMVDLMGATRAYGLNSSAVQAEKGMITSALEIAKS